jgi:hypothetical protein
VQAGIAVPSATLKQGTAENSLRRTVEMTVRWKAGKSEGGIPHSFHRTLEIPRPRQDSHIPTVPATVPFVHPIKPNQDRLPGGSPTPSRKENSVAEPAQLTLRSQDHSVLETILDFRIILRLENASAELK